MQQLQPGALVGWGEGVGHAATLSGAAAQRQERRAPK